MGDVTNLNLRPVPSRHVRDSPARLFANSLLGRAEQMEQAVHDGAVEHRLRLRIISGHDIAHSSQSSLHHRRSRVPFYKEDTKQSFQHFIPS